MSPAALAGRFALGEREGDPGMLIDGHLLVGTTLMTSNDLHGGLEQLDRAIALFPAQRHRPWTAKIRNDPRISSLTTSAFTLWMLGYPDRAAERADAALALAVELQHPFTSAYAQFHAGVLRLWRRDSQVSLDIAIGLRDLADRTGSGSGRRPGAVCSVPPRSSSGVSRRAWPTSEAAWTCTRSSSRPPSSGRSCCSWMRGPTSRPAGRPMRSGRSTRRMAILGPAKAHPSCRSCTSSRATSWAPWGPPGGGGPSAAESWYQLAFERAGVLDARMARLRAATRLARLRMAEGEPEAAARTLRPVYDTFTEGFDTADLVEARELLAFFFFFFF